MAVNGSLEIMLGKTVRSISYDTENGLSITFTDGTIVTILGGVPRSNEVDVWVMPA